MQRTLDNGHSILNSPHSAKKIDEQLLKQPAVVAERFRACDQIQVDCHSKTQFQFRSRHDNFHMVPRNN